MFVVSEYKEVIVYWDYFFPLIAIIYNKVLNNVCRKAGTEKVGSDFDGESYSIFYIEVMGKALLIRKTQTEKMQF